MQYLLRFLVIVILCIEAYYLRQWGLTPVQASLAVTGLFLAGALAAGAVLLE